MPLSNFKWSEAYWNEEEGVFIVLAEDETGKVVEVAIEKDAYDQLKRKLN